MKRAGGAWALPVRAGVRLKEGVACRGFRLRALVVCMAGGRF